MTTTRGRSALRLGQLLMLVAGAAFGLSIWSRGGEGDSLGWILLGIFGGIALVGPILFAMDGRARRRPITPGRLIWLTQGTAAWLLWPPVVIQKWGGASGRIGQSNTAICFAYGTPLMALFMVLALTTGGWIRPRRKSKRPRRPIDMLDRIGLILGLGWACAGLYFLAWFWWEDLRR